MTLAEIVENPLISPKNTSKSGTVYQVLKRRILLGYLTDECLITEQALAQEFSCSQSTVREALLRLQECGLVDRRGYQGTFVTRTTPEEAILMVRLRLDLERAGIARAVEVITDDQVRTLRDLSDLFDEHRAKRDLFGCSEIDRVLHRTLFSFAGMPMMEPILRRALLQLHRFMLSRHQGSVILTNHNGTSHSDILDAIEDRDADRAQKLVTDHIAVTVKNFTPDVHKSVFAEVLKSTPCVRDAGPLLPNTDGAATAQA
jgi:DNA-binding GntR family transcriptional regulator